MKIRIAMWATLGFLVAGAWVLYAFVTPPEFFLTRIREPLAQAALYLSCPIAYAGRYYPIGFWWVMLANAATYAAIGLAFEMLRRKFKPYLLA